jgi:hypothetical protein
VPFYNEEIHGWIITWYFTGLNSMEWIMGYKIIGEGGFCKCRAEGKVKKELGNNAIN